LLTKDANTSPSIKCKAISWKTKAIRKMSSSLKELHTQIYARLAQPAGEATAEIFHGHLFFQIEHIWQ
jgi:hypothetical protein